MKLSILVIEYEEHQKKIRRLAPETTLKNYLVLLREFVSWIEGQLEDVRAAVAGDLSQVLFVRYIDHTSARVPKKARVIRAAVRSWCLYLMKMKWPVIDITKDVEMPSVEISKRVGPPPDAIDRMLAVVETMDLPHNNKERKRYAYRAVLYLLTFVGLRIKEIEELRVEDIDLLDRQVFVRFGKGGKERYVRAPDEFWPVITAYLAQRPAYPDSRLLVYTEKSALGYASIGPILARIMDAAGLSGEAITPHCLRHAFAVRAAMNNAPVPVIQSQLGHTNPATTYLYLRTPQKVNSEQAQFFGRAPASPPPDPIPLPPTPPPPKSPAAANAAEAERAKMRRRIAVFRRQ